MVRQVVPLTDIDKVGLIKDIPPVALPPNAFSDCNNVRFRDGAVIKMEGDINIFPHFNYGETDRLKYVVWWPSPNLAFRNSGYYVIIVQQLNTETNLNEDNVYVFQAGEIGIENGGGVDLTPDDMNDHFKGSFEPDGLYQHTFFQGGFSLIINNGLQAPKYLLDNEGNLETAMIADAEDLPGWDSYAVTIDGTDETVATVTAGVVRSFGDFLVAGNLVERDDANEVLRGLPGVVRTSDIAGPGEIPTNWNPFASGINTADEFTLTNDGIVQDMVALQGNLYIYSNSSISVMTRTGNTTTPISVRTVTDAYGALTTDSVLEFDGRHIVVGSQDIYLFGGHPGSIQSIADGRVRNYFYESLNPVSVDQTFILRYQQKDEIWICYATSDAVPGTVNRALIWNYRLNNWTQRDLVNVLSGNVGPVPGGGVPTGNQVFTGDEIGDAGDLDDGARKYVQYLPETQPEHLSRTDGGQRHEYTIYIQGEMPESTVSEGLPVYYVTYNEDDFTTEKADSPIRMLAQGQNDALGFLRLNSGDEFNFAYDLPSITYDPDADETFAEQVVYPILVFLAQQDNVSWPRGTDPVENLPAWFGDNYTAAELAALTDTAAPLQVHLTNSDNIMAVSFETTDDNGTELENYTTRLQFDRAVNTYTPATSGTEVTGNTLSGHRLVDDFDNEPSVNSQGVAGQSAVYQIYMDDTDIDDIANLDDYIFFPDIPDGAVVYRGTPQPFSDASRAARDGLARDAKIGTPGQSINAGDSKIDLLGFTFTGIQPDPVRVSDYDDDQWDVVNVYRFVGLTLVLVDPDTYTVDKPDDSITLGMTFSTDETYLVEVEFGLDDMDGLQRTSAVNDLDGGRRVYWDFSDTNARTQLIPPITGATLRALMEYDLDTGATRDFPLQVWAPTDETLPDSLTANAYNYPSDTVNAAMVTDLTVSQQAFGITDSADFDATDPPVMDFGFCFEEFYFTSLQPKRWTWAVPNRLDTNVGGRLVDLINPVDDLSEESQAYNLDYSDITIRPIAHWFEDDDYNNGHEVYRVAIGAARERNDNPTEADRRSHKLAIAQAISHAFQSNANSLLRSPTPPVASSNTDVGSEQTDWSLDIISEDNAAVRLVGDIVGPNGRINVDFADNDALKDLTVAHLSQAEYDARITGSGWDSNIVIVDHSQGRHSTTLDTENIDNASPINPVRLYLPPLVNVFNANSFWAAEGFDVDVQLGPIGRTIDPAYSNTQFTRVNYFSAIGYDIVQATTHNDKPLLSYMYDDSHTTGLEIFGEDFNYLPTDSVPDDGNITGTLYNAEDTGFTYPMDRDIGSFFMTRLSTGNGVDAGDNLFDIGDWTTKTGSFDTLTIPTYTCIQLSDPLVTDAPEGTPDVELLTKVYLFETTGATTRQEYIDDIVEQINVRIPTVNARDVGDGSTVEIEPITFTDASNFVIRFLTNSDDDQIELMRNLTDDEQYVQDILNPIPNGQYKDRLSPFEPNPRYSYLSVGSNADGDADINSGADDNENDKVFDILRPWSRQQVNFAREYPIFAAAQIQPSGMVLNKTIASDIGFNRPAYDPTDGGARMAKFNDITFVFDIKGNDAPEPYTSQVQRVQLGLTPEFDTEQISSIALWTDGSTLPHYRATDRYKNVLEVRVATSNAPGAPVDFDNAGSINEDYIGINYKTDVRETGRFLSIRIADNAASTEPPAQTEDPEDSDDQMMMMGTDQDTADVKYRRDAQWRLAGLQLEIGKAGTR